MKILKKILIILIIAATIFTVVKCNRTEDEDNIKQEQGEDTLPKEDKKDEQDKEEKQDRDDEPKDDQEKEERENPIELG